MIKNVIAAAAVALGMVSAASAADLPSRKFAPAAPVVVSAPRTPFFVGLNAGATTKTENGIVGAVAGYEFNQYVRTEATYDHYFGRDIPGQNLTQDVVAGNLIAQYSFGPVTPYVLAGAGYRWAAVKSEAIYNVGGGVRYALTDNVELDGRYKYVSNFNNNRTDNVFTVGFNVKF